MYRNRLTAALAVTALGLALMGPLPATFAAATGSQVAAAPDAGGAPLRATRIDARDRDAVEQAFLDRFAPAMWQPLEWSRSTRRCDPGVVSPKNQAAVQDQLNFARALAGVDPVTLDPVLSAKAQQAVAMMRDSGCYTEGGAWAINHSNRNRLTGFGENLVGDWIAGYLTGGGVEAGTRSWILTPETLTMGSGMGYKENVLVVFGSPTNPTATRPEWISWPTPGYFPAPLEPAGRWSLSATDDEVDLSAASVKVAGPDGPLPVTIEYNGAGAVYGIRTLTWRVEGLSETVRPGQDQQFTVTVSGIKRDGVPVANRTWSTTLFQPQAQYSWSQAPTISGTPLAGETLTADPGVFTPTIPNAHRDRNYGHQWFRDGKRIRYAVGSDYELTESDVGHRISVKVSPLIGGFPGIYSGSAWAAATVPIEYAPAPTATELPVIRGTASVGRELRVTGDRWENADGTEFDGWVSWQWLRDGVPIRGTDFYKYTVRPADRGHRLSVRLTAESNTQLPAVVTTKRTARVGLRTAPQARVRPRILGKKRVGRVLKVTAGEWRPRPERLRYRWLRNGQVIKRATGRRYTLRPVDRGDRISVRVIAIRSGHAKGRVVTKATRRIRGR